jgi:hypothetical protein
MLVRFRAARLARSLRLLVMAACLSGASHACAQTLIGRSDTSHVQASLGALSTSAGSPELRAEQQALLDQTIRNPDDLEATYAYVELSRRLGDAEAAIGALERLVNYNPTLARANYELGVLYHQLGSYDAAARYLRAAASSPTLEAATKARVDALYGETVKQQKQSRWSGFLQTGLRYQSNANFVPPGGIVRLNGQDLLLSPRDRRQSDGSVFGLAQIANDYDLENQRGDVLETRFVGFGSKQFRATEFDFGYVEASFGPRFGLPELMPGASIKPYVIGQTSALSGERRPYASSAGAGVTMRLPLFAGFIVEPGIEARALSINDRDRFTSTFNGGTSVAGYLVTTAKLTEGVDLEARFIGLRIDGGRLGPSLTKRGANVALSVQFDPPSELIARKWKVSPFIGAAVLDFDRANAFVDPRVTRGDTEFRAGVVLDAPATESIGISALVQYDRINSNLPNYRQRGFTVLGGPTVRF